MFKSSSSNSNSSTMAMAVVAAGSPASILPMRSIKDTERVGAGEAADGEAAAGAEGAVVAEVGVEEAAWAAGEGNRAIGATMAPLVDLRTIQGGCLVTGAMAVAAARADATMTAIRTAETAMLIVADLIAAVEAEAVIGECLRRM